MLHTRLLVGSLLALAAGGVLVADPAPYPGLFVVVVALGVVATREFRGLLPPATRPPAVPTTLTVLAVLAANWWGVVGPSASPWEPVLFALAAAPLIALSVEMATYRGPGNSASRVANTAFAAAYLGLLATFAVRVRLDLPESALALTATIFVPKCGDIGAYTAGRLFGRHLLSPRISPKKTWEGFAGGLVFAVGTALAAHALGPVFRHGILHAVAFGLVVGTAAVLGDLAESMLKRDVQAKDASGAVPGFGGVLDVIDSVLFAAPVAYLLLRI